MERGRERGGEETLLGGETSCVFPLSFCIKPDNMVIVDNLIIRIVPPYE